VGEEESGGGGGIMDVGSEGVNGDQEDSEGDIYSTEWETTSDEEEQEEEGREEKVEQEKVCHPW